MTDSQIRCRGGKYGRGHGPSRGQLSFWRIVDIPFETCVAALDNWWRSGPGGEFGFGRGMPYGPVEHDRDTGTRRIQIRLARGPLRAPLRMRLDIDRWSSTSTAVELIPCGRVRPTATYFRAGHLLLDSLTRSLSVYRATRRMRTYMRVGSQ
jgi:hypothetical protein